MKWVKNSVDEEASIPAVNQVLSGPALTHALSILTNTELA